jgi:hypothetical protein
MTQADRVFSTPPTNTSAINPVDPTRRGFITLAAGASIISVGSIAAVAAMPIAAAIPNAEATTPDPVFALIVAKRAADIAHGEAIDAQDDADVQYGYDSEQACDADDACGKACDRAIDVAWQLARTAPTTFAGVVAVLRFTNQLEDEGMEWPDTDRVGAEGWHYELRATMAAAIEALIKAGRAVRA